ncbi:nitrate reductase catalytic subunit NapA [Helicobacter sp. 11S02629-2]|uniref:nitrate reductase catalytic subunit NapA n=1 Tax=Helicobacter sp. 11S02629-2 TaxID=1476195 RepID=UPI000BA78CCE|nr:nitrate reductase catalytic subunit NapA [Helicobacter sp. 11S02629-2]PAF45299.1 nitrate reductase catalytic subunit [Helicobacter sp. 11S02629-2]
MESSLSRRDFIKTAALASAAVSAGLSVGTSLSAKATKAEEKWVWDKSVCRFCGTGCGIMIATQNDKIVAVKGDLLAPVNKGITCIKGYFTSKIMYAQDRLKEPLLRLNDKGEFDKKAPFKVVSWQRAFDEMEKQFKKYYNDLGPKGIGVFGSGQYTIQEGYAAVKLVKAGWRSNNIDPNARHCMASAVGGFMQVFGIDEPSGCYDDIEITDTVITWGSNMAEMHPMLWSRVIDSKFRKPDRYKLINLSTFSNPTSEMADIEIIFKPSTDLAIWNYIAHEIVYNNPNSIDWDFVKEYCVFTTGFVDIGYGMREDTDNPKYTDLERETMKKQHAKVISEDEAPGLSYLGMKAGDTLEMKHVKKAGAHWAISFEEFKTALKPYTLDYVAKISKGDASESLESYKKKLKALANYYMEKDRKVMSFWTMGFNQHQRGVWVNEQSYMVHFLVGKQGTPGNCAFSLTGQPSACGTAREVGTFMNRLPADMVVTNPEHVKTAEKIWHIPTGVINTKPGSHFVKIMRDMEDAKIKFVWVQVNNPWQNTANANHWIKAAREMDNFIVVSECYPGISARVADLILPSSMIYEKWGAYGNAERRTQHWKQSVTPIGNSMPDVWQMVEFSKRFKLKEVWAKEFPELGLKNALAEAKSMGYSEDSTLFDVLFNNKEAKSYKASDPLTAKHLNTEAKGDKRNVIGSDGKPFKGYGTFIQKYLWEEYRKFGVGHGHDLAPFDLYYKVRGLRWPVVDGKETKWRFNAKYDYYARKFGDGKAFAFYGHKKASILTGDLHKPGTQKIDMHNKAKIFFRPYMEAVEMPDSKFPFWLATGRVLEHWHSGTMTMRVPELFKAVPEALCYMHPSDAKKLGVAHNDIVWAESRRGKVKVRLDLSGTRNRPPSGLVFIPWFDERVYVNKLCLDATDPISFQTDYKKCAINIYKA